MDISPNTKSTWESEPLFLSHCREDGVGFQKLCWLQKLPCWIYSPSTGAALSAGEVHTSISPATSCLCRPRQTFFHENMTFCNSHWAQSEICSLLNKPQHLKDWQIHQVTNFWLNYSIFLTQLWCWTKFPHIIKLLNIELFQLLVSLLKS